jgi:outer membrane protein assembly factor BamB
MTVFIFLLRTAMFNALTRRMARSFGSSKPKTASKATPVILEDKILASGLDDHLYCINAKDGTLIWDYQPASKSMAQRSFPMDASILAAKTTIYIV